jgi:hypothetical protein
MALKAARMSAFRAESPLRPEAPERVALCLFHEQSMDRLEGALTDLREQLRQDVEALSRQARSNGEALARLTTAESAVRRERQEYLADRADLWAAVNKLRFHVYVWLGVGLVMQVLAPLLLRLAWR